MAARSGRDPDFFGHRVTPVAGVAGHASFADMGFPIRIDMLCHLDHAPGDDLGVQRVVGKISDVMAIGATFFGRNPLGDRHHVPGEFAHAEVAQHFDVLVHLFGARPIG